MGHWISLIMVSRMSELVQKLLNYIETAFASHSQTIPKQDTFSY